MYLRVTRGRLMDFQRIEEVARFGEDLVVALSRLPGCQGVQWGANRTSGSVVVASAWDSEEHAHFPPEALDDLAPRLEDLRIRLEPPEYFDLAARA